MMLTLLEGKDFHSIDRVGWQFILLAGALYGTTYYAQDFEDVAGDAAVGRKTLPMVYPSLSRFAYLITVVLWTFGIAMMYNIDNVVVSIPAALALLAGVNFVLFDSVKADRISFIIHGVSDFSLVWFGDF